MQRKSLVLFTAVLVFAASASAVLHRGAPRGIAAPRHAQGVLREYTLVAEPVRWEIQPGLVVDGWGYNGQVPGPTIHVTEGDLVRVHLVNHLPEPTTIHWHGIDVPTNEDGVPGLSQDPVEPGDRFTYEFVASNPGTRMYHSHTDTDAQIQLGLVGAFIIDPRQPEPEHYDHDYTYILTEKSLDFTPQVAMGAGDVLHRDNGNGRGGALQRDLFLMNERAGAGIEPMEIPPGGRVRIRLINLGDLAHSMHLHGQAFKIIATDGNPVPPGAQLTKDTVLIGPGERYDLVVEGTNPGVWMFHCHINNHAANGMTTVLTYDGSQPFSSETNHGHGTTAPLPSSEGQTAPLPISSATGTATHQHDASATPAASPGSSVGGTSPAGATGSTPAATSASAAPAANSSTTAPAAGPNTVVMMDNRYTPSKITVPAGTTVTWMNNGNNMHNTTSLAGLWDSGLLTRGQTFQFSFTQPGTYQFLCSQHFLEGMRGTITVTP